MYIFAVLKVQRTDRAGSRKQKIIKMEKWSVKVVYNPEQFKKMGFDGEIAKFMRENKKCCYRRG